MLPRYPLHIVYEGKGKVHPCTLRLCTSRTAHKGNRGIAILFLDHGTSRGKVSASTPAAHTPGKDPVPILQEAGWSPGPVWTGAENLAPTKTRSPDRPARSQSLYRLSYPAPFIVYESQNILLTKSLKLVSKFDQID